jgi:membrane-associated phospholipid phosphatase
VAISRLRARGASALVFIILAVGAPACALAGGGPLGIDHILTYDNRGVWKRDYQLALIYGLLTAESVGAVWEGGQSRWGRTLWQSVDATVAGAVVSTTLKYTFSRVRPIDSQGDPNLWFKGKGNESFPSGEVTVVSSIVTPLVLEYGREHPLVYGLELLPVYDSIARMKVQAHWQTDVLAGFAIGTACGWWMHRNPNAPYVLSVMPHSIYVGISKKF